MRIKQHMPLTEAIEHDIVTFSFKKMNGDIRLAEGTRNLNLIPEMYHPKGTGRTPPSHLLVFFDTIRNQWRSCRINSLFSDWFISNKDLLKRITIYDKLGLPDPYDNTLEYEEDVDWEGTGI